MSDATRVKKRPYVGLKQGKPELFSFPGKATTQTHPMYHTIKGPFKTLLGATFFRDHPYPQDLAKISIHEIEHRAKDNLIS